jgi:hypothetical protein
MQEGAMKDTCKDTGAGSYSAEGETKSRKAQGHGGAQEHAVVLTGL